MVEVERADNAERACGVCRASAWGCGIRQRAVGSVGGGYRVHVGCAINGQAARIEGADDKRERAREGRS
jgi:hypothetical protein